MSLNSTAIKSFKPQSKPVKYFDERGLYIQVNPNGKKWWRFKYRFEGKEKLISLGTYPDVGLALARDKRDELRKKVVNKIDPSEERKKEKEILKNNQNNTFEATANEWLGRQSKVWTKSHLTRTASRLKRDIYPEVGKKHIADVTANQILTAVRKIESRGAIESAHRTLNICSQVFRYSVLTLRAKSNPCLILQGALSPVKKNHLSAITSPREVSNLIKMINSYHGNQIVQCALRLAPLVFVRPGELRTARWEDIDLKKSEWRYFISKTKTEHIVPLSKQSVMIFKEIHPVTKSSVFVFPNSRSHKKPMSENAVLCALRSLGLKKEEMTGHGFRAMARTLLDEVLGFRPDIIEHQLAHSVKDPLGRAYNRTTFLAERKKMMQDWADWLYQ